MRDIDISRVMTTNPATVSPDDTLDAARALIDGPDIHHLPVVDGGKLVGLLSSADLLKVFLLDGGESAAGVTVRSVMTANPVTLGVRSTLRDAARKLSAGSYHALPVVEPDGTLVGIVTSIDLIEYLLRQLPTNDGSMRPDAREERAPEGSARLIALDIQHAITEAREILERGEDNPLARALLGLHTKVQRMEAVCKAAELYIRTGQAEREHGVLLRRLDELRALPETIDL